MSNNEQLRFSDLVHQMADAMQTGAVLFDRDLQIIDATQLTKPIISAETAIDLALQQGTMEALGKTWKKLIESSLELGQKNSFNKIPYRRGTQNLLLDLVCVPIFDNNRNETVGGVMLIYDITAQHENAQEASQSDRLTAIGRVAGKVAHELNNPLDGILRYANLSLRMLEQNQTQKAVEYINHCKDGLQRMTQIITEMLEFSRNSHPAFETSPADKLLEDALRSLDGRLKKVEVSVIRKETGQLPHFKSDSLYQVFCNLIKNASDAMEGKGKLTITISRSKDVWRFDFQDTGPGFAPYCAEELFKPFFTTKVPGRGTGLGLSISKDIVEKLGGQITAQTHPQSGACFSVYLPSAAAATFVRS